MKKDLVRIISILLLTMVVAGCSSPAKPAVTGNGQTGTLTTDPASTLSASTGLASAPSSTPDACSTGQIEAEVQRVHRYMREFDDASILASNLPREQLSDSIAGLQRIRREAQDEEVPPCLTNLKEYQVDHMNTVIDTLVAFLGGADTESLERGIALAREQHDQYTLELARLLGVTIVPATDTGSGTPSGTATP